MSLPHSLSSEEFFIVRHGESKSNEMGLVGGQLVDWPLSENGKLQVEGLKKLYEKINAQERKELLPGYIMHTGMLRTQATAQKISEAFGGTLPIMEAPGFKDWNFGDMSFISVKDCPDYSPSRENPPHGETRQEFYQRSNGALANALKEHKAKGMPVVVAHQGTIVGLVESAGFRIAGELPYNAVLHHFKPRKVTKSGDFLWAVTAITLDGHEKIVEKKVRIEPAKNVSRVR